MRYTGLLVLIAALGLVVPACGDNSHEGQQTIPTSSAESGVMAARYDCPCIPPHCTGAGARNCKHGCYAYCVWNDRRTKQICKWGCTGKVGAADASQSGDTEDLASREGVLSSVRMHVPAEHVPEVMMRVFGLDVTCPNAASMGRIDLELDEVTFEQLLETLRDQGLTIQMN